MDDNKARLDRIDDLLDSTSEEKRFKLNFAKIESVIGSQDKEIKDADSSTATKTEEVVLPSDKEVQKFEIEESVDSVVEVEPIAEVQEFEFEEPVNPVIDVKPIAEEVVPAEKPVAEEKASVKEPVAEKKAVAAKEPVQTQQQKICIIDETSTSVVIEQGPDISVNEIVSGVSTKSKKEKKPKEPLKLKPIQIVIMALVGLVALWVIMFTVDHTLAANGISPVFSRETETFADGSASYKGLGYKVQFKFDSQGNLTQQVCPFWEEGPNDIVEFPGQ